VSIFGSLARLVSDDAPTLSSRRLADRQKAMGEVRRRFGEQLERERAEAVRRQVAANAAHDAGIASAEEAMQIALEQARAAILEQLGAFYPIAAGYVAAPAHDTARALVEAWNALEQRTKDETGEDLCDEHLVFALAAPLGRAELVAGAVKHGRYIPDYSGNGRRFHSYPLGDAHREIVGALRSRSVRKATIALDVFLAEVEAMPETAPRDPAYVEDVATSTTRPVLHQRWVARKAAREAAAPARHPRGPVLASIHGERATQVHHDQPAPVEAEAEFRDIVAAAQRIGR
jgi:hypothetical protein